MNRKFPLFPARSGAQSSGAQSTEVEMVNPATGNEEPRRPRRRKGFTPPNGFTLMELLIVMAIIAILMLIAIPTVGALKKHANQLSAIQSVRAIQQAEMQFSSTYPTNGYACTLQALGGDPSSGAPSATGAQILQGDVTSGHKSGYVITISNCQKVTVNGTDRNTSYTLTAVPETVGKTGDLGYCGDDNGPIKQDPAGGTNCTQLVQ